MKRQQIMRRTSCSPAEPCVEYRVGGNLSILAGVSVSQYRLKAHTLRCQTMFFSWDAINFFPLSISFNKFKYFVSNARQLTWVMDSSRSIFHRVKWRKSRKHRQQYFFEVMNWIDIMHKNTYQKKLINLDAILWRIKNKKKIISWDFN